MLMLHLRGLGEESLARRTYEEQKSNKWSGLVGETEETCKKLGIENVHSTSLGAKTYRKLLTKALPKENENRIKQLAKEKNKCERIFSENYGKKEYLAEKDIAATRLQYKTRFRLLEFAGNYSNDRHFAKTQWLCWCKTRKEDESHLLEGNCSVYGQIRKKFGIIQSEESLIRFFSEVLEERERLEEAEEQARRSPSGGEHTTDAASVGPNSPAQASLGSERTS